MNVYIRTDDTGRLTAVADPGFHCGDGEIAVELPEGFASPVRDWVLKDGVLVHDPLPLPEPVPSVDDRIAVLEEENAHLKEALDMLLSGVTEVADGG